MAATLCEEDVLTECICFPPEACCWRIFKVFMKNMLFLEKTSIKRPSYFSLKNGIKQLSGQYPSIQPKNITFFTP